MNMFITIYLIIGFGIYIYLATTDKINDKNRYGIMWIVVMLYTFIGFMISVALGFK